MRQAITPRNRLLVTIRFLASGQPFSDLQYASRIPQCTLSQIVPDTCRAILNSLQKEHLKVPNTKEEWLRVANDFYSKWDFPNCFGVLDGKHIRIKPPAGKGAKYWCYKKYNSIILLALADAHARFIYVDVGANGRVGDSAVYAQSQLKWCITRRSSLNIPTTGTLPNSTISAPFVVLADDAFPLSVHLLKPYPMRLITSDERNFNYRLSRARGLVECAFGILANRFRIFLSSIHLEPNKVKLITMTACTLHNFLINRRGLEYSRLQVGNDVLLSPEDDQRLITLGAQFDVGSGMHGSEVRDLFKEYLSGPGHIQHN